MYKGEKKKKKISDRRPGKYQVVGPRVIRTDGFQEANVNEIH